MFVNNKIIDLSKLASKDVYRTIIKTEIEIPTAKSKFEQRVDNKSVSWVDVCMNIYRTTIDTYSRQFQFRIIHNYLHVNSTLYKWKLTETGRCAYCFNFLETVEHLFCTCPIAVTLYRTIQEWCDSFNITIPEIDPVTIIYGILPCTQSTKLINHIILLYKMILFDNRDKKKILQLFQILKLDCILSKI